MAVRNDEGVPLELANQCEKMNKDWMSSVDAYCQPYFQTSEFGDDWRIRIRDIHTDMVLVNSLAPDNVGDGHSLMMVMTAVRKAWQEGVKYGKNEAAFLVFEAACTTVGALKPPALTYPVTGYETKKKFY